MSEQNAQMSELLDETLDDLADLPSVAPFTAGAHKVQVNVYRKKDKDGKSFRPGAYLVKFTHKEVLELSQPDATPPKAGDQAMLSIFTKKKDGTANEIGQGQLKMILSPIGERLGMNSVNAILEALGEEGVEAAIVSGTKKQEGGYPDQMVLNKFMLT